MTAVLVTVWLIICTITSTLLHYDIMIIVNIHQDPHLTNTIFMYEDENRYTLLSVTCHTVSCFDDNRFKLQLLYDELSSLLDSA